MYIVLVKVPKDPVLSYLLIFSDLDIVMFLKACEWNLKESKETLEAFFTYRTNLPEFFSARDPSSKELQDISQVVLV